MDTVESVSWEEPVLGVYGGDHENAPRVGSEPMNSRSLGGHLIHCTTACLIRPSFILCVQEISLSSEDAVVAQLRTVY
ncbi:hypothetical protein DPMN_169400 [Dreissena polymorpha]|uniref:Uncharacterized protein n=1 Tax=Dreissena polymorpha TaxID=45954 RepID=A0A9D4DVG1_DREPO|nr:hypothetical protein DPMN_169400 [Dreissena polymorpha]